MKLNMSSAKDVTLSFVGANKKIICQRKVGTIFETFKDHYDTDAIMDQHGPVFCLPLNGKLVSFPETEDDFEKLVDYSQDYLEVKNMTNMNVAINAHMYSVAPTLPNMGYPEGGYHKDIYELDTDRLLNVEDKVKKEFSKELATYQAKKKLCMMFVPYRRGHPDKPSYSFINKMCDSNQVGTHTICQFDKKISLKLSGLCSKSPVDKVYTLMEPKRDEKEGKDWADYYRFGTFSGENK